MRRMPEPDGTAGKDGRRRAEKAESSGPQRTCDTGDAG